MWDNNKKEISQNVKEQLNDINQGNQTGLIFNNEVIDNTKGIQQSILKRKNNESVLDVKYDHTSEILKNEPKLVLKNDKPPIS